VQLPFNFDAFLQTPWDFKSPFPSSDSVDILLQRFDIVGARDGPVGLDVLTQSQARAFSDAIAIANRAKAVWTGDLLSTQLPQIAKWVDGPFGTKVLHGLFAAVEWPRSTDKRDFEDLAKAMGFSVAMAAISAIPVYGKIAAAVVMAGRRLGEIIAAKFRGERLELPWAEYSRDVDEDLIQQARDTVLKSVNWTPLFSPPFEHTVKWTLGLRDAKAGPRAGVVFAPVEDGQLAWRTGAYGCIPGTVRVAGQSQVVPDPGGHGVLERYMDYPSQKKPGGIPWRSPVVAAGDYFPALAQLGAALWQQVLAAGSPDMYKVHTVTLHDSWGFYYDRVWGAAFELQETAPQLLGGAGPQVLQSKMIASELAEAHIAVRRVSTGPWDVVDPEDPFVIGMPFRPSPRLAPIVHERMFIDGPVDKRFRNPVAWIEEDTPRRVADWPYLPDDAGHLPRQYMDALARFQGFVTTPAGGKVPRGYRAVPFPLPEIAAAKYNDPFAAIIKPAIAALKQRQFDCLERTLVCAYVRPTPVGDLPMYDAFRPTQTNALQKRCLEVRELLLKHDARFGVRLVDVDAIDPAFAKRLRDSGVTNSPAQLAKAKLRTGPLVEGAEKKPEDPAPPPKGGVAFERAEGPGAGSGGGSLLALFGLGATAYGGYRLLRARRRG
jgi:hypothetical protein